MRFTSNSRLIFFYVAMLGVLLALTVGGLYFYFSNEADKKFDAGIWMLGAAEAEGIAANLKVRGVNAPDDQTVINYQYRKSLGYDKYPLEKYVTVVDANGKAADFTENMQTPMPFDKKLFEQSLAGEAVFQTIQIENVGEVRAVYMPVRGELTLEPFVVIIGLPKNFIQDDIQKFWRLTVLAFSTLLVITALSAYWLTRNAIQPIKEIAAAAAQISGKDLTIRLPDMQPPDEIGRLSDVLNKMLARLEKSFEAQRNLSVRIAHELRTPLTILKGENQVTLKRTRSIEEYEAQLRSNLEEAEKMEHSIEELLLFARYEAGETEMPRRSVRLDVVVSQVAKQLRSTAEASEIEFKIENSVEVEVFGEEQSLERLVCKFAENALNYTPNGGSVTIRSFTSTGHPILEIEDTGVGIAPEDLPHIFERFYRAANIGRANGKGTGIGLAMAEVIARMHNAEIKVESKQNTGTKFIVKFPVLSERNYLS